MSQKGKYRTSQLDDFVPRVLLVVDVPGAENSPVSLVHVQQELRTGLGPFFSSHVDEPVWKCIFRHGSMEGWLSRYVVPYRRGGAVWWLYA